MSSFDFLNFKSIIRYLIYFAIILFAGAIFKDTIALLIAGTILFFSITKNLYRSIEVYLIWFFTSNFFVGQGYITNAFIFTYIAKPSFLLFIIFVIFISRISSKDLNVKYIIVWILFLILTLLSSITQRQSPFVIITISSFFIIFLVLQVKGLTIRHYHNILNIFVAVAVLQTIVSLLQVSELIQPASKMMGDGDGDQYEWIAGLEDVACGTFGAAASHIVSWFSALMSLFLLLVWSITTKRKYLFYMIIIFLQLATADSKIIVGVTIFMLIYMLFYIYKERISFNISIERYILLILIITLGSFGFLSAWNAYYQYYSENSDTTRTDINAVYKNEGKESLNLICSNINDWGKIKGYQYIYEDFIDNDIKQLIWGYGMQGYDFNGKMGYIQTKDIPLMQLNNFTNSISGLTSQFAKSGLIGFILFVISVYFWFRHNCNKIENKFGILKNSLLKIYLPFTLLASFLYSIELSSIPVIVFASIISICVKLSNHIDLNQITE